MLLSDRQILEEFASGQQLLDPWDIGALQPASVDVRLDHRFRTFANNRATHIDPADMQAPMCQPVEVLPGERFVLHPGEFALGCTYERLRLPQHLAARLEGKSSLGRLGLATHVTAGFIDPGFVGQLTLELSNVSTLPIVLWPGMKIGQVCFLALTSPVQHPYGTIGLGSHYQGQDGPTPSRSYSGFDRVDTRKGR